MHLSRVYNAAQRAIQSLILPTTVSIFSVLLALLCCLGLSACDLPQVQAQERIFLPLQLDFIGEYQLPPQKLDDTPVGGLSGITYDRQLDQFYAVSDDRSDFAPARFYTLKLQLDTQGKQPKFIGIQATGVTRLKNPQGEFYLKGEVDTEGIALTPNRQVFVSSEGVQNRALPFVEEFNLQTGAWLKSLALPPYFLTKSVAPSAPAQANPTQATPTPTLPSQGVQNNYGFESLTLSPQGDRLFTATESALLQDFDPNDTGPVRCRLLHYLLDAPRPELISEHVYPLDPKPAGVSVYGLVELLSLDNGGHFLSLERGFNPSQGFQVKLFQVATGAATDIRGKETIRGPLPGVQPVRKQLLLDLSTLNIPLDNLEGMTLGPRLSDGSQSLLLVSDNNFQLPNSQFLLFRMRS